MAGALIQISGETDHGIPALCPYKKFTGVGGLDPCNLRNQKREEVKGGHTKSGKVFRGLERGCEVFDRPWAPLKQI